MTVTTWLDLAGSLLLVVALVVFVWPWTVAGALATGGVAVLLLSFLVDRPRKPKGSPHKPKGSSS